MAKRYSRWLGSFILLGIVWGVSLACYLSDTYEAEGNSEWRYFTINPEILLQALDQGDPDAFILMEATPTPSPSEPASSIHWSQVDYYRIAQAIHEQAWLIPLGAHNLYSAVFEMDCSSAEGGAFSEAEFRSNDIIETGKENIRLEHWTWIEPLGNTVLTIAVVYRPNVNYKRPFDLAQFQITADKAVQIAESSGGFEARLHVGNDCRISAITPGAGDEEWRILYVHFADESDHIGAIIYKIDIDAKTGKYDVIYP